MPLPSDLGTVGPISAFKCRLIDLEYFSTEVPILLTSGSPVVSQVGSKLKYLTILSCQVWSHTTAVWHESNSKSNKDRVWDTKVPSHRDAVGVHEWPKIPKGPKT